MIGVSAFHLSVAVTPHHVVRTGEGRETGTGYSKPDVQPKRRPRDVTWRQPPSGTWGESETPQAHWNWEEHQTQETTLKHESWTWGSTKLVSRSSHLNLGSNVHAVMDATAVSRMIAPRPTVKPLFDLSRCQSCFQFAAAGCVLPREVGHSMLPDARESRVIERSEN